MFAIRPAWLRAAATLCLLLLPGAFAAEPPKAVAPPLKLKFAGQEYVHRWSKNGQNEFTPAVQTDLKTWKDMVTVLVNERVSTGDQLAELANGAVANYSKAGEILRTDSKPRSDHAEAEHFIAAMLRGPGFTEAVFARVMLVEGRGVVVVYSHRAYGAQSAQTIATFMDHNGDPTERALMQWSGLPKLAQLRALPQAAR